MGLLVTWPNSLISWAWIVFVLVLTIWENKGSLKHYAVILATSIELLTFLHIPCGLMAFVSDDNPNYLILSCISSTKKAIFFYLFSLRTS